MSRNGTNPFSVQLHQVGHLSALQLVYILIRLARYAGLEVSMVSTLPRYLPAKHKADMDYLIPFSKRKTRISPPLSASASALNDKDAAQAIFFFSKQKRVGLSPFGV